MGAVKASFDRGYCNLPAMDHTVMINLKKVSRKALRFSVHLNFK